MTWFNAVGNRSDNEELVKHSQQHAEQLWAHDFAAIKARANFVDGTPLPSGLPKKAHAALTACLGLNRSPQFKEDHQFLVHPAGSYPLTTKYVRLDDAAYGRRHKQVFHADEFDVILPRARVDAANLISRLQSHPSFEHQHFEGIDDPAFIRFLDWRNFLRRYNESVGVRMSDADCAMMETVEVHSALYPFLLSKGYKETLRYSTRLILFIIEMTEVVYFAFDYVARAAKIGQRHAGLPNADQIEAEIAELERQGRLNSTRLEALLSSVDGLKEQQRLLEIALKRGYQIGRN